MPEQSSERGRKEWRRALERGVWSWSGKEGRGCSWAAVLVSSRLAALFNPSSPSWDYSWNYYADQTLIIYQLVGLFSRLMRTASSLCVQGEATVGRRRLNDGQHDGP